MSRIVKGLNDLLNHVEAERDAQRAYAVSLKDALVAARNRATEGRNHAASWSYHVCELQFKDIVRTIDAALASAPTNPNPSGQTTTEASGPLGTHDRSSSGVAAEASGPVGLGPNDALDAARYRWLRDFCGHSMHVREGETEYYDVVLDSRIDKLRGHWPPGERYSEDSTEARTECPRSSVSNGQVASPNVVEPPEDRAGHDSAAGGSPATNSTPTGGV